MANDSVNIFVKCMDGTLLALEVTQETDIKTHLIQSYPELFPLPAHIEILNRPEQLHNDDVLYVLYEKYICPCCSTWLENAWLSKNIDIRIVDGVTLIDCIPGDQIHHMPLIDDVEPSPIENLPTKVWDIVQRELDILKVTRRRNLNEESFSPECLVILDKISSANRRYYLGLHRFGDDWRRYIISIEFCNQRHPDKPSRPFIAYNLRMNFRDRLERG